MSDEQNIPTQQPGAPIYDISSGQPVLGEIPHENVTEAVASGQYVFPQGEINVINPDGEHGTIPAHEAPEAFQNGFRYATPKDLDQAKYGTFTEQVKAAGEGAVETVLPFGIGAKALTALGDDPEAMLKRQEAGYGHAIGAGAGLLATLPLGGFGAAGALGAAGEVGAAASGIGKIAESMPILHKIGSAAIKGFIETGLAGASSEVDRMVLGDPHQTLGSAAAEIGLAGLIGGAFGGGIGAVAPIWKATIGNKVGAALESLQGKMGGFEGKTEVPIKEAVSKLGTEFSPVTEAILSNDPEMQQVARNLIQSDTTTAGKEAQAMLARDKSQLADATLKGLGTDLESVSRIPEISEAQEGGKLAKEFASEYAEKQAPTNAQFDKWHTKYVNAPLDPSREERAEILKKSLNENNAKLKALLKQGEDERITMGSFSEETKNAIESTQKTIKDITSSGANPGTIDKISERLATLGQEQGWDKLLDSDIGREFAKVQASLSKQFTVGDLSKFISQVGEQFNKDVTNGPMRRAGGMIKEILNDEMANSVGAKIAKTEGAEAYNAFKEAKSAFSVQAKVKNSIDDVLHAKGSVSSYDKAIREMGRTDPETLLRRLTKDGDAHLLETISANYPKTAQAIKDFQLKKLLQESVDKAKGTDAINFNHLLKKIDSMSPEMRKFTLSEAAMQKIEAARTLQDHIDQFYKTYNFSNTGRTVAALTEHMTGSAIGAAGMLLGHNPVTSATVGHLAGLMGKATPDAVRLGLLKFMSTAKPISSEGFKSASDYVATALRGLNRTTKAVKDVFKSAPTEAVTASPKEISKLDKLISAYRKNPNSLLEAAGTLGHYMPEHASILGETAQAGVNYLANLQPNTAPANPFDGPRQPNPVEKARYERALSIAQQPLQVLGKIKEGSLTAQDLTTLKTIYPAMYNTMAKKLMEHVAEAQDKGTTIPYKTRMGISQFLGQPLDSTMTPQGIIGAQPSNKEPSIVPGAQQSPTVKHSTAPLSKLSQQYQTPGQARQQHRLKD